jgi:TonB-dependent receptor
VSVDSIVAEDIGQFPDKNVGEALSRITGVQLSRDFGEGSQVAIRGVEPNLNRVEINGMSVLSTNGTAGRGAELRELPAELIKSIDVYKGTTADLTEGGVGGTVSIKTNKPLDFKKRTFATTARASRATLRGGVQPRGSLLLADKFLDGKLGLMANFVYDKVLHAGRLRAQHRLALPARLGFLAREDQHQPERQGAPREHLRRLRRAHRRRQDRLRASGTTTRRACRATASGPATTSARRPS